MGLSIQRMVNEVAKQTKSDKNTRSEAELQRKKEELRQQETEPEEQQ